MAKVMDIETENDLKYQFYSVSSGSFQFKVRAPHDAHIALTMAPRETDPMFEVIIGGWSNTKSVIRRNRTKPDKCESLTPKILHGGEFRGFWIRWDDGFISVGREGQTIPFVSWMDDQPFPIAFVGVCTAWGASGSWKIEDELEFNTENKLEYMFRPMMAGSLEFGFRGPHNCHVCLTKGPAEINPMYEFIIGGWENTQSVIRFCRQKPDKVSVPTPGIMNPNEFKKILIEWRCGRLQVRDGPNGAVIMEWVDLNPFHITHFGVRTGWGARGQWHIKHFSASSEILWVDASGGQVPPGAVRRGQDACGEPLFVARASHAGAMVPGKLAPSLGCAYVSWGGKAHGKRQYQVLVGGPNNWVPVSGDNIPRGAIRGGNSEDGESLYIGRVRHKSTITMGKVQQSHGVCYISFDGEEIAYSDYEILVA